MARIKLLVFALLALALVGWNYMTALSAGGGQQPATPTADPKAAANQLAANAAAVNALVAAQQAGQQAAAHVALTSEPLASALAAVAKEGAAPSAEQAKPLTEAAEKALAELPEGSRKYVVVALATAQGGLAVVPGHDPLLAGSFPWIDEARKAGAAGKAAEVAGKKVLVFAAPVRAVVKDEVKDLGTLAIAFGREPADLAALVESSPVPVTLVANGAAVASSDKAHSAEAASAKAAGEVALKGAAGKAIEVPGYEGALAVVSAQAAQAVAAQAPAGGTAQLAKNLQISLGVLGLLAVVFVAIMGSGGAPAPREEQAPPPQDVRVEPASLRHALGQQQHAPPEPEPLEMAPNPEPEPEPIMASGELLPEEPAPEPPPMPTSPTSPTAPVARAAPPPMPAQPEADRVPGFDELFGSPPPAPKEATRPAVAAAPPPLPMPPPAPPAADPLGFMAEPAPAPPERTSTMSREMVAGLQAQSSRPEAIPLPGGAGPAAIPLPGSAGLGAIPLPGSAPVNQAIPLPSSAPDPFALAGGGSEPEDQPHERTVVAAIPQELLRAATPQARPGANGPGMAGPMGAANAEELHFQDVYREFLQVRKRCGEPDENLTFEKFSAKLRKNKEQLVQKYACKSVRFQVYVKEGKAALKATPVKEA